MTLLLPFLLLAFLVSTHAIELTIPNTVQLDLIFPRNNTVYKPVYPFPIVFSVINGSEFDALGELQVWWKITRLNDLEKDNVLSDGFLIESPLTSETIIPDEYLFINASTKITNTTTGMFSLYYRFYVSWTCLTRENLRAGLVPPGYQDGIINFNLSDSGETVDIQAAGPCPTPLAAAQAIDTVKNGKNKTCPILPHPHPPPTNSCALVVDAGVASRVSSAMLQAASCTADAPWPVETDRDGRCITYKAKANMNLASMGLNVVGTVAAACVAGLVGVAMVLL